LLWGCSPKTEPETEAEPVVTVDVAPVLSSSIQLKVGADAVLYPLQQAAIIPKVSSPVKKFYVDRGAPVRAGQLLAELENQDLMGAVAEARAAYEQAEANYETTAKATVPEEARKAELDVKAAKDSLENAQRLYDARQSLFKEGAIAEKDVKDAQLALAQTSEPV
jgi:multidrug efflux pump subunit AcrA (membrane-fusion protein)